MPRLSSPRLSSPLLASPRLSSPLLASPGAMTSTLLASGAPELQINPPTYSKLSDFYWHIGS